MFINYWILSLFPIMIHNSCVVVNSPTYIYPTDQETFKFKANEFIEGQDITYKLETETEKFELEQPFHLLYEKFHNAQHLQIVTIKARELLETGYWTHEYAILGQDLYDNSWAIYYSDNQNYSKLHIPEFQNQIKFLIENPLIKCFDFEYLNQNTFVVDCFESLQDGEESNGNNIIYVISTNSSIQIKTTKMASYKYRNVNDRKIQYHVFIPQYNFNDELGNSPIRILLRGQYAYGTENSNFTNLDGDCVIDLLRSDENYNFFETGTRLDRGLLIQDLQIPFDQQQSFKFKLIDFKVLPNGDIYVLDSSNGIFVYQINRFSQWKFIRQIQTLQIPTYAFEVYNIRDEQDKQVVQILVQFENILVEYIDGVQKRYWNNFINAQHPSIIQKSEQYIIINSGDYDFSIFSLQSKYQIHHEQFPKNVFILNPNEPNLILISSLKTKIYQVGFAKIVVHSNGSQSFNNELVISAIGQDKNCTASLNYQIVKANDTQIYDIHQNPFPPTLEYPFEPIFVKQIASGPQLVYKDGLDSEDDRIVVEVYTQQNLNIEGIQFSDNITDVTYTNILINHNWKDKNKFWYFQQFATKIIQIFECYSQSETSQNVKCSLHKQVKNPKKINLKNNQLGWNQDTLNIFYQKGEYQILTFSIDDLKNPIFQIQYDQIVENKITSYSVINNIIYVVLQNKLEVHVYSGFVSNEIQYIISLNTLLSQGFTKEFLPKNVFGSSTFYKQLSFIQSTDSLIFGQIREKYYLIKIFDLIPDAQVKVHMGKQSFIIIQSHPKYGSQIQEWNYENLNNIYLMKNLPLYNYRIQRPLTTSFCQENGILFIRAFDNVNQVTVILTYQSNVLSQQSLYQVINVNQKVPNGQKILLAAAGNNQIYLYFNNYKSDQQLIGIFKQPLMFLKPSHINTESQVTMLNASIKVENQGKGLPIVISYPIQYIKINTDISQNLKEQQILKFQNELLKEVEIINQPEFSENQYNIKAINIKQEEENETKLITIIVLGSLSLFIFGYFYQKVKSRKQQAFLIEQY